MKFNIYNKLLNRVTTHKITLDLDPSSIYNWLQISLATIVQATEGKKKGSKSPNIVHQNNKQNTPLSWQTKEDSIEQTNWHSKHIYGMFGLTYLSL